MVLKSAVQALKKAEIIKAQVDHTSCNIDKATALLNDPSIWSTRQQLATALQQVLILDLDYALDQKVEQDLWTFGFKNYIATLQTLSRDKKNQKRLEFQALLTWCLDSAFGFYITLLEELCEVFQLDLPFRRRCVVYGNVIGRGIEQPSIPPQRSSSLYICQYCLVHLGDIARYRNQRMQAEAFYRHAILLSPSSGQPYNQLALIQASRGDRLATVFYYVRSMSLSHPFPPAASNLSKTLEAASNDLLPFYELKTKMSVSEYISAFCKLHGLLQICYEFDQAEILVKSLISALTALVATNSFSSQKLSQMLAINLYSLKHIVDNLENDQLTIDEKRSCDLILDLIAGFFNACLLPVYTIPLDNLLRYNSLASIKLTLDWLKLESKYLSNEVFKTRLQIWPSLCQLLNVLQSLIKDFEFKKYHNIPLPEDRQLQAFLPLEKAFSNLDFSIEDFKKDLDFLNKLRAARLVNLGLWLSTYKMDDKPLIINKKSEYGTENFFEPVSKYDEPLSNIIKELEQLTTIDSETTESSSTDMSKTNSQEEEPNIKNVANKSGQERLRTGILKPQGSLERAREEREQALLLSVCSSDKSLSGLSTTSDNNIPSTNSAIKKATLVTETLQSNSKSPKVVPTKALKKGRQNVAMQAILKKFEENSKQVKFQTDETFPSKESIDSKTSTSEKKSVNVSKLLSQSNQNAVESDLEKKSPAITSIQRKPPQTNLKVNERFSSDGPITENFAKSTSFPSNLNNSGPATITQSSSDIFPPPPTIFKSAENSLIRPPVNFSQPNVQQLSNTLYNYSNSTNTNQGGNSGNYGLFKSNLNPPGFNAQRLPFENNEMPNYMPRNFSSVNSFGEKPSSIFSNENQNSSYAKQMPNMSSNVSNFPMSDTAQRNLPWNPPEMPMMPPKSWWQKPNNPPVYHSNSMETSQGFAPHYNMYNSSGQNFISGNVGMMPPSSMSFDYGTKDTGNPWNPVTTAGSGLLDNNQSLPYMQQMMHSNQSNSFFSGNSSNQIPNIRNSSQPPPPRPLFYQENVRKNSPLETNTNIERSHQNAPGYSLFNSSWIPNLTNNVTQTGSMMGNNSVNSSAKNLTPLVNQQSLFTGPGPSPLERLLEQQKHLRDPSSNNNMSKGN